MRQVLLSLSVDVLKRYMGQDGVDERTSYCVFLGSYARAHVNLAGLL